MKTLADIKRRAVKGARLLVVEQTRRPVLVGTVRTITDDDPVCSRHGTRPPEQRRCYDWTGDTPETEGGHCTNWPKASEVTFIDADTFEYPVKPGPGTIRLRFLAGD